MVLFMAKICITIIMFVLMIFSLLIIDFTSEKKDKHQLKYIEKITKVERIWKNKYLQCVKSKKIIIPIPIFKDTLSGCTEELEEIRNTLNAIKLWCDPHCREELESCIEELQHTTEDPYYRLFEEI